MTVNVLPSSRALWPSPCPQDTAGLLNQAVAAAFLPLGHSDFQSLSAAQGLDASSRGVERGLPSDTPG
jgi:hypothetical protein